MYASRSGMAVGLVMYCWAMAYLTDLEARSPFGRRSFYDQRPSPLLCPWRLCLVAVALFAVGKAMGYFLIQVAGVDVHTSMRLATRHCDQPNWIHSSTSVMASYARVSGTILGRSNFFLAAVFAMFLSSFTLFYFKAWHLLWHCVH